MIKSVTKPVTKTIHFSNLLAALSAWSACGPGYHMRYSVRLHVVSRLAEHRNLMVQEADIHSAATEELIQLGCLLPDRTDITPHYRVAGNADAILAQRYPEENRAWLNDSRASDTARGMTSLVEAMTVGNRLGAMSDKDIMGMFFASECQPADMKEADREATYV